MKNRQKKETEGRNQNDREWLLESESGSYLARLSSIESKGLKPKQSLQSHQYQEFSAYLATKVSYRTAIEIMQRSWHQAEGEMLKRSTYEERIESAGSALAEAIVRKSENILAEFGVDSNGIINEKSSIPSSAKTPLLPPIKGESEVRAQIREYNRGREADEKIKYGFRTEEIETSDKDCCYISIDDILVKHQKDSKGKGSKKKQKFVSNTVVHIQKEGQSYTLTAAGLDVAMKCLMSFLLSNHLLEDTRLIFFSDGATSIREAIEKYFSFRQHTLILDWFHLENKCTQFLSMGVKGSMEQRKAIKSKLAAILWAGNVEKAKKYIGDINKKNIKSQKQLDDLIAYLDRKSQNIACYAIRKVFGLRTSSNLVEKANDRVVGVRQKKKGMSWSTLGSHALATLTAASINGGLSDWFFKREIAFKMVA